MAPSEHAHLSTDRSNSEIKPPDKPDSAYLESLVKADYESCHPGETFDDLKRRARFTVDDKGILGEWMALARQRAAKADAER